MPDRQQQTSRAFLYGIIAMAGMILLALAGISYWAAHSYFVRPHPTVKIGESPKVQGFAVEVVDKNGAPIGGASVTRGDTDNNGFTVIYRADSNGRCDLPYVPRDGTGIIVSAKGFMSKVLPVSAKDAGGTLRAALAPSRLLKGCVLDPAGSPEAGAIIAMIGSGATSYLYDGELSASSDRPERFQKTSTDSGGNYAIEQLSEQCQLIAFSEKGWAKLRPGDLGEPPNIRLSAWGRVEGNLIVGGKPAANQKVECYIDQNIYQRLDPALFFQAGATTDPAGQFTVEKVIPGDLMIAKVYTQPWPKSTSTYDRLTQVRPIRVVSGRNASITVGRIGRQVVGRLAMPERLAEPVIIVRGLAGRQTPATQSATSNSPPDSYVLEAAPDRSFVINDVLPGSYTIFVRFFGSTGSVPNLFGHGDFTMPEIPGGDSDEPLNIGDVVVNSHVR